MLVHNPISDSNYIWVDNVGRFFWKWSVNSSKTLGQNYVIFLWLLWHYSCLKFSSNLLNNASEVHEQAISSCDALHHERRILLKQEIGRMILFFTDQPTLLAPNIQVINVWNLMFADYDFFAQRWSRCCFLAKIPSRFLLLFWVLCVKLMFLTCV